MSLSFPDISLPVYPLEEEWEDTSITSKFEDGSLQTRPKFTRSRGKWTIKWTALPTAEYNTLMSFIKDDAKFAANTVTWTHPVTGAVLTVRITSVGKWTCSEPQLWSGSLDLTEV